MTSSNIPPEFQPLLDRLVEQSRAGNFDVNPHEIETFQKWLEADGYDWFLEGWIDELVALDLNSLASWTFSDGELRAYMGIEHTQEIDDALRVQHGRERIDEVFESGDNGDISTIKRLTIVSSSGQAATLGYRAEFRGQAGVELFCQGVFKCDEDFLDHLAARNYVMSDGSSHISDSTILGLWGK